MKNGIKKAIRIISRRTDIPDRKCYVCGETIVENHHILKVAQLAGFLTKHKNLTPEDIPIPTEDLCPTHHTKAHILYEDKTGNMSITQHEADKISEMVHSTEECKVTAGDIFNEVEAYEFNKIIERTIQTTDKNIEKYTEEADTWENYLKQSLTTELQL